jgi:biopolymer transport protein ExbD
MLSEDSLISNNRKTGVKKMTKHNLRIDMTPMVDLGFLLISFFVITTQMQKPSVAILYMPKDGPESKIAESKTMTVLIGKGENIYHYNGDWADAKNSNRIMQTDLSYNSGLGNKIRIKQELLFDIGGEKNKNELMVLIKAGKYANYSQIVGVLDEMLINGVTRYALVNITEDESKIVEQ